jgi:hypothetical protein
MENARRRTLAKIVSLIVAYALILTYLIKSLAVAD